MNSWTRGRTLGHGSTATVSLATSLSSGDVFAVKSAELSQSEFLQREQRILSSIASPHIVSYRGFETSRENGKDMYNLFLEYIAGGTLTDLIQAHGGRLEESLIGFYTCQIVEALDYLHSNGVVHCDIKGRNILIGENGAKIADFGCAKRIEAATIGGTPMYMAPEVARGEEQGCASDVWALGCTVVEMATGGSPWGFCNDNAVSTLYRIGFTDESPAFPENFSDEAKDFLDKCLRRNPRERWTAKQLLNHSFLGKSKPQIEKSISFSPTSILDQRYWSSVDDDDDESDGISTMIEPATSSASSSGSERIRRLCLNSGGPSWEMDENWVTVRCNGKKKDEWSFDSVNEGSCEQLVNDFVESNISITSRISACKYGKDSCLLVKDELLIPYTSILTLQS